MSDKMFEIEDLVWAKMKSYPYWPARIVIPPGNMNKQKSKKAQYCVLFFGTKDYAWMSKDSIVPHSKEMVLSMRGKKMSSALQSAMEEIIEFNKNMSEDSTTSRNRETDEEISPNTSPQISNSVQKKAITRKEKVAKASKKSPMKKSSTNESGDNELSRSSSEESPTSTLNESENNEEIVPETSHHSEKKARKIQKEVVDRKILKRSKDSSVNNSDKKRKCPSTMADDSSSADGPDGRNSHMELEPINELLDPQPSGYECEYVDRPTSPIFDVTIASDYFNTKEITATAKKIGFLGLGKIGRGVVKNLLHSHHKVTVWNRSAQKCEPFVRAGACKGSTPADVVAGCDITFCCVSDTEAVKRLVFENCGILRGLEGCAKGTKGYVEMTSIDPVVSHDISRCIIDAGGRYLEAPFIGSRHHAEDGSILSLVAGDRDLFNDCQSCFFAFTKSVYYIGSTVGSGSKMNLIHSMLCGTTSAALAEAMALVERYEMSKDTFLDILKKGQLKCPLVEDKGNAMVTKTFTTNRALKHQQEDLKMALDVSNAYRQTTAITSAANQVYKRAQLLNYSNHDVSAVLMGAL